jgi:hypothetical protein
MPNKRFGVIVKLTWVHHFFARNWPARLFAVAVPSLFVVMMAKLLGPAPEIVPFEAEAKSYLFLLGMALLLGLCVVALAGPFILGPIYHHRAELNGAPFLPGDHVTILVGPNEGQVAHVAEVWEWRGDLRIKWEPSAPRKGKTIFQFVEVIKSE